MRHDARTRSTWPCGSSARWLIFAEVKSAADAFLHAATHAPQPMQAAASMAFVGDFFGIRNRVAVLRAADVHRGIAAGLDDPVEGASIDDEVLDDREGLRPPGLES